jgi:hypothetical protein
MKLNDLKKIIKEEIAKILQEQPETQEKEKTAPKTAPATPKTKPSPRKDDDEWETPEITPEPKKANRPEVAKKTSEKISKRYTDILKKKK